MGVTKVTDLSAHDTVISQQVLEEFRSTVKMVHKSSRKRETPHQPADNLPAEARSVEGAANSLIILTVRNRLLTEIYRYAIQQEQCV